MQRFAITKIWNDERHIKALEKLRPKGWMLHRRARGYRFGRRDYHQSFPLNLCAYFTMYCAPKEGSIIDRDASWYAIQQCEFRGFNEAGKPILRLQVAA